MQDPYSATMGGFSKVTHFLRDTLLTVDKVDPADIIGPLPTETSNDNLSALAVNSHIEGGFELITAVRFFKI